MADTKPKAQVQQGSRGRVVPVDPNTGSGVGVTAPVQLVPVSSK